MRNLILSVSLLAIAATAQGAPPREESPAPREVLADLGAGNSDEELQRSIATADAHPLGSAANPVRVAGPEGTQAYFGRLRCADGRTPAIGARRDGGIGAHGSIVALYPLDCGSAAPGKIDILVDIYHEENVETRAPAGFRLAN